MTEKDFVYILMGLFTTLSYTLIALLFGFMIAIPVALMRMSSNVLMRNISRGYVSILRGTPVMLQLFIWYFAVPRIIGMQIAPFAAGVIAFSINSSAYVSEIVRAGIMSIDKGQYEAAKVLGITKKDTFFDIILPQAIKNLSPALINEMISLTKETAIIGVIGVTDMTRRAQLVSAEKYDFFMPLVTAAAGYYLLAIGISHIYNFFAKKM